MRNNCMQVKAAIRNKRCNNLTSQFKNLRRATLCMLGKFRQRCGIFHKVIRGLILEGRYEERKQSLQHMLLFTNDNLHAFLSTRVTY